jgi:hypothetical protein
MVRTYVNRSLFIGLAAAIIGVAGCSHPDPPPKPRPTVDNPMHMPADVYDKIKNMSPEQRARIEGGMQQSRPAAGTSSGQ